MPTAQEVYASTVQRLPPAERLRLAALILDELTQSNLLSVDESDTWSDEDIEDLRAYSFQYAATRYPEEDDIA